MVSTIPFNFIATWMPEQASTISGRTDWIFAFIFWVCMFFFLLVSILMVAFVIKYRHKPGVKRDTAGGHNTALEIIWTIIPTILVLIMFYYGIKGYLYMAVEPPNAMEVNVKARTWSWTFTYPNGATDKDLYIPINKPVRLILSSDDVIHSLFVPAFRIKKDVVPGRFNRTWVQATEIGDFDLYCAAYCGQSHSQMLAKVHVLPEPEWRAKMQFLSRWDDKLSPIEAGMKFYNDLGCKSCHSVDGATGQGPTFKDLFGSMVPLADGTQVLSDEEYIRESIVKPNAKIVKGFNPIMQSFEGQLKNEDILAITAYLKSISANYKGDLEPLKKITPQSPTNQPAPK